MISKGRSLPLCFVLAAVLASASCLNEPPTAPQAAGLDGSAAEAFAATDDVDLPPSVDEPEFGDVDGPFEAVLSAGRVRLAFRFAGAVRAYETARIRLRAFAAGGKAVRGTVTVDFGDRTPPQVVDIRREASLEHRYEKPGKYRIVATLNDDTGYRGRGAFRLRVGEARVYEVDVSWDGDIVADEAERFSFRASRSLPDDAPRSPDAGCSTRGTFVVDFGDGAQETIRDFACEATRSHTYAEKGRYALKVTFDVREGPVHEESYPVEVLGKTAPPPPPGSGLDAVDPFSIAVVGAKSTGDARGWPVTRTITVTAFRERHQEWTPDPAWPETIILGGPAQGNLWIVRDLGNGRLEGAPMEWFVPGQTRQYVDRHHIAGITETWPDWDGPVEGEVMYFFLSTPARIGARSIDERTQIVRVVWGQ